MSRAWIIHMNAVELLWLKKIECVLVVGCLALGGSFTIDDSNDKEKVTWK